MKRNHFTKKSPSYSHWNKYKMANIYWVSYLTYALNKWDEKDMNVWLLLNKSRYDFNGHGGWIMEHAYTVNCWPKTSTWRKHYLATAHRLRMASWNTFMAVETLVCGRTSRMNTRLAHNWPVCCHGNLVWDDIRFIRFGAFLRRDWPRPVVPDRLVRIRKFIKFIN